MSFSIELEVFRLFFPFFFYFFSHSLFTLSISRFSLSITRYVNLNYLGFHKILKKHDKNLPHAPCQQFYVAHLHHQ